MYIGAYGGHFDIIVIYLDKPKKSKDVDLVGRPIYGTDGRYYTVSTNDWEEWFGLDILRDAGIVDEAFRPYSTQVTKFIEMKLTACWDKDDIQGLNFHADS